MRMLAIAAVALAACVTTNAAVLDPGVQYQRLCADAVRIFTSAERVPGEYQEVALLSSKGESGLTDERQMLTSQRKKAAQLGANGLIVGDVKEPTAGTKIIGSVLGTGAERKGSAVAIYIPGDSVRVRRACGATLGERIAEVPTRPAPAAAPSAPIEQPLLPPGTRFIGDGQTKRYYPIDCPAAGQIHDRYFFRTVEGAHAAGFALGPCTGSAS